jgi:hypothetical protein
MKPEELLKRLAAADEAGLAPLADQLAADTLEAPRAVVHAWSAGKDEAAGKACLVAMQLREFLVDPAVDESGAAPAVRKVSLLEAAVEALLPLRRHALRQLDPSLKDPTELAADTLAEPLRKDEPPRRVCDEAYVYIRRLARLGNPAAEGLHTDAEFLAMPHAERDQEIRRWQLSKACRALYTLIYDFGVK